MSIQIKPSDRVYLPSQVQGRRCEQKSAYVARVFVAPAVRNPFDLSAAPLRGDVLCAELRFPVFGLRVFADLEAGDIRSLTDPVSGETLYVYVGVQASGNGSCVPTPSTPPLPRNSPIRSIAVPINTMTDAIKAVYGVSSSSPTADVIKAIYGTSSPTSTSTPDASTSMDQASSMVVGDGYLG